MPYRSISWLAGVAIRPFAGNDLAERLVIDPDDNINTALIWVHGASVGELTSAQPVISMLAEHATLIITANTTTGRNIAGSWGLRSRLAPLDVPQALTRFLNRYQPRVAVTLENELWPNRSAVLSEAGVRQIMIGARMSSRSAQRWAKFPWLIKPMLSRINGLSAQSHSSEKRLTALGLPEESLLPSIQLKLLGPALRMPGNRPETWQRTVLAASTHEGEDEQIITAFMTARKSVPGLQLIIAPRHPNRADAIAALMTARGISPARRSAGADETAPVLLADTLGEMARWYDSAAICITGGSLVPLGGHTPWEPAAHECAILHGPHVSNFAEDYAVLHAVHGTETLASDAGGTISKLASDPHQATAMGIRARKLLLKRAGKAEPLVKNILLAAGIVYRPQEHKMTNMRRPQQED